MAESKKLDHIAIIMDGNGRWAEKHSLQRAEGHKKGAERVADIIHYLKDYDIHYLTLYAFSTENWKRSEDEVNTLMELLCQFIDANTQELKDNKIRILPLGRIDGLPEKCSSRLKKMTDETSKDYKYTVILALNYGAELKLQTRQKNMPSDK